jgi:hypothetical protein
MSDNEDNDAPVEKKAKRKTVDWKSKNGISIMKSLFRNVMDKKPWLEKNSGASYNTLATVATKKLEQLHSFFGPMLCIHILHLVYYRSIRSYLKSKFPYCM